MWKERSRSRLEILLSLERIRCGIMGVRSGLDLCEERGAIPWRGLRRFDLEPV